MRRSERTVAYTIVGVSLLLAGAGGAFGLRGAAVAQGTKQAEPARVATCDIYDLVNRLVESPEYAPQREAEQKRSADALKPMEEELQKTNDELQRIQSELQGADPKDPAAQAKFNDFQAKRQGFDARLGDYQKRKGQLNEDYSKLVSGQFTAAHKRVSAEAARVGRERGYTHVIAHKRGDIDARDPGQLIEAFLSRPVVLAPDDADVTEAVRQAMNLPVAPPAAPAPATGGAAAPGASAPGQGEPGGTATPKDAPAPGNTGGGSPR